MRLIPVLFLIGCVLSCNEIQGSYETDKRVLILLSESNSEIRQLNLSEYNLYTSQDTSIRSSIDTIVSYLSAIQNKMIENSGGFREMYPVETFPLMNPEYQPYELLRESITNDSIKLRVNEIALILNSLNIPTEPVIFDPRDLEINRQIKPEDRIKEDFLDTFQGMNLTQSLIYFEQIKSQVFMLERRYFAKRQEHKN